MLNSKAAPTDALRALALALAPLLRPLLVPDAEPGVYNSEALPRGVNKRTFARWCRLGRIADAQIDGRGWRCSHAAWREARSASKHRAPVVHALGSDEEEARAMVEAARAKR